VTHSTNLLT